MTKIHKSGPPPRSELGFEMASLASEWAAAVKKHGGWDPAKGLFTPLKKLDKLGGETGMNAWYAAESICAAYEEGQLTEENVATAFATPRDAEALISLFIDSAHTWVNERHVYAWMGLGVSEDDAGDFDLIADYIRDHVLAETD